ncbi:MAG: hypothetical protein GY950_28490 [bacterium]|nr:hypothetical protein [bacterium]
MDRLEIVSTFFEQINGAVDSFRGKRDNYYIARECLLHSDYYPGQLSRRDERYFIPLITSFLYLQEKNRHELAERIYRDALAGMTPGDLVDHHFRLAESVNWDRDKHKCLMSMDQSISFLANIGEEHNIAKYTFSPPGDLEPVKRKELEVFANSNWIKLFKQFQECSNPWDCQKLLLNIINLCKGFTGEIGYIKDGLEKLDFRKWLLKRQLLGIYTAIQADCFHRGCFEVLGESVKIVEKIADLAGKTYRNYIFLICYSLDKYVHVALDTLQKIKAIKDRENHHVWYEAIPVNLINQLEKIGRRYSDVKGLVENTTGVTISLKWAEDVTEKIKIEIPGETTLEALITWLSNAKEELTKANEDAVENLDPVITEIETSVLKAGENSFWERCRERFAPDRVRLLVASLDNKYSTESASIFKTPVAKMDGENAIPTELCVLKKWGSTASIFEEDKAYNSSFGGGFFIMHNGVGLCVDPGPDFLRNLTRYTDFDLTDISGVACTHTHYDHFADFKRILLGIREYNREVGYKRLYYFLPDPDDQDMHPEKLREEYCVNVFEEHGSELHSPGERTYYHIPNTHWGRRHGFRIHPIRVTHNIYNSRDWSHALLVEPLNDGRPLTSILFSGDAEYGAELFSDYQPELLLLNCASVRFKDITSVTPGNRSQLPAASPVKSNQLGYTGILSLLYRMPEYKLALLSDFFEAQGELDARLLITESLKKDMAAVGKAEKLILAAEPGMRVSWDKSTGDSKMNVHCSFKCAPGNSGFVRIESEQEFDQFKNFSFPRKTPIIVSCSHNCDERKKFFF